jgi:hypothetical protein
MVTRTRLHSGQSPRCIVFTGSITAATLRTLNGQENYHEQEPGDGQHQHDFNQGKTLVFL